MKNVELDIYVVGPNSPARELTKGVNMLERKKTILNSAIYMYIVFAL